MTAAPSNKKLAPLPILQSNRNSINKDILPVFSTNVGNGSMISAISTNANQEKLTGRSLPKKIQAQYPVFSQLSNRLSVDSIAEAHNEVES